MKLFKAIGRFFESIFKGIKRFFEKVFEELDILIAIFLIAVFVFPPLLPGFLTFIGAPAWAVSAATSFASVISGWSVYLQLATGLGVAALVAPDGVEEIVETVSTVAGEVAAGVGEVIGEGAAAFASGAGIIPLLAIGAAIFLLTRTGGREDSNGLKKT